MLLELPALLAARIWDVAWSVVPITLGMAAAYTALTVFSSQACNPGKTWWRARGIATDALYWLIIPFAAPYIRIGLMIAVAIIPMGFVTTDQLNDYITHGLSPVNALHPVWQGLIYLVVSDFLLYWIHRLFHGVQLWPYHAVHHSAEDVDWTTAYRFHPINLCLGPFLVDVLMLFAGISPIVMVALAPWQTISATFVHANLNWTLGPLKYVIATPVFHRWHHSPPNEGGEKNFAPTFSLWDVMFGTFYMPQGKLPQVYGVDDTQFPQGFVGQLIYPFLRRRGGATADTAGGLTASAALESAGSQPRS
jgi:sterol desaturase/sphingolipid hydroxylase (fatty acid hydroxylase superfamily)